MSKRKQNRFLNLYKPVHDRFERFCRARVNGEMPYEDLINETLLTAYKKLDELKNESVFLSFLIGISIRILSNTRRKRKSELMENELVFTNYADPENVIERQFEIEMLYDALVQLPEYQREALILYEITGFSVKEIMEIQNSGASAVKQRLARGRTALAKIIHEMQVYKK